MFVSRVVPLAVLLAASACHAYHTNTLRLEPTVRSPTRVDSVRVLGQEPQQPFTVIAFVSVSPNWVRAGNERLARRLAREAAKLGGDAVLLGTDSFTHSGVLTGKVIVFDREAARSN